MNELDLFAAVIAIADPAERAALLDRECAGRPDLRQRLDELLQAHARSHELLDQPVAPERTAAYAGDQPGAFIAGRYKLLEAIGEGGMGTVWVAEQTEPVRRKVALKLIKAGMDSKSVLARFEAERQALAVMDHPNIAKVLDGGLNETGRPFFVMEYVKGVPITEYCDATRLSVADRLSLFVQVCQAVQHAHQKGIIHRDLKPSNILVAPYDDRPVPKVIDFGLAKAMHQSLTEKTLHTAHETVLGTPLYMSPEQAQLNNLDVDTRSDVYSLGVLLYELLTGTTPLEKQRFKQAAWDEIKRIIREEEPPRPSARLSSTHTLPSVAACRQTEPLKLTKQVRGELDWIVMKSLEKDRSRRYETANGFAADLLRYLNGEAVQAHPPSAAYRLRKFARRNKGQVLAAGLVLVALLAGIIGTSIGLIRANHSAENERQAKDRESDQRARAEKAFARTADVLDLMVSKVTGASLATQTSVSPEQKKFLKEVLTYYQEFAGEKADDESTLHRTARAAYYVSNIEYRLGRNEEAATALRKSCDGYAALLAKDPASAKYRRELALSHSNLGAILLDLKQPGEAAEQHGKAVAIREKLAAEFPADPEIRSDLSDCHSILGQMLQDVGKNAEAEEQYRKCLAIREKLAADHPALQRGRHGLANAHSNLGVLLNNVGRHAEADEQYRETLALREKLAAESPDEPEFRHELAKVQINLGTNFGALGKPAEMKENFQKALAIQTKLVIEFPADAAYRVVLAKAHFGLSSVLENRGQLIEAIEQSRKAVTIMEKLAADFPADPVYRKLSLSNYHQLACQLGNQGQQPAAEEQFQKALAIAEKLASDYPAEPEFRAYLADVYGNVGKLLQALGKKRAEELNRKSLALLLKLAADYPAVPRRRHQLAIARSNLAIVLNAMGKHVEADEQYREALSLREKLAAESPHDPEYRRELAVVHTNLGFNLNALGKPAEAVEQSRKAVAIVEKLAADFPADPIYRKDSVSKYHTLGRLLAAQGQQAAAAEQLQKALAIAEKLAADFPAELAFRQDAASANIILAYNLQGFGKLQDAEKYYRRALAMRETIAADFPNHVENRVLTGGSYCNVANMVLERGSPSASLPLYDKAIATLTPIHQQDAQVLNAQSFLRNSHQMRAIAHELLKQFPQAIVDWNKAVELSPKEEQGRFRMRRVVARLEAGQTVEAMAEVDELAKAPSWQAEEWYNFACLYTIASGKIADKKQQYADRAMEMLQQAVKAGFKDAAHIKKDPDVDPLRNRDDFKKLLADLEANAATKPADKK